MFEIEEQTKAAGIKIDHLICATSTGATQAGLVLGAWLSGFSGKVTGISIDQVPDDQSDYKYQTYILRIANAAAKMLNVDHIFSKKEININYDYLGQGYGVLSDLDKEATCLLARNEGILVGPVYTGRALGGLIDLIRKGHFTKDENVLFLHSGDDVTLHAHTNDLLE